MHARQPGSAATFCLVSGTSSEHVLCIDATSHAPLVHVTVANAPPGPQALAKIDALGRHSSSQSRVIRRGDRRDTRDRATVRSAYCLLHKSNTCYVVRGAQLSGAPRVGAPLGWCTKTEHEHWRARQPEPVGSSRLKARTTSRRIDSGRSQRPHAEQKLDHHASVATYSDFSAHVRLVKADSKTGAFR
jgi:hypothetical protein